MNDKHKVRNSYPCNLKINDWELTSLKISQYYKTKPGREMINDDLIIKLVESLNGQRFKPDPKKRSQSNWDYWTLTIKFESKFYRLVSCHQNNSWVWGIVNIYPITIKNHEKKNNH